MADQVELGLWHLEGEEGLQQDNVMAVALFRTAANLGDRDAQTALATCYYLGRGLNQSYALAEGSQGGRPRRRSGTVVGGRYVRTWGGRGKNLPLGKRYLELSAAQEAQAAVAFLRKLRKCIPY